MAERKRKSELLANCKGFTLLEALLTLFVTLTIVSLLPLFIQLFQYDLQKKEGLHMFEWEIFLQQAQMELRESAQVKVSSNQLLFIGKGGDRIVYEKRNGRIRRRVNGYGHEVLLQHVDTVQFVPIERGIMIKVADTTQQVYERVITHIGTVEMVS